MDNLLEAYLAQLRIFLSTQEGLEFVGAQQTPQAEQVAQQEALNLANNLENATFLAEFWRVQAEQQQMYFAGLLMSYQQEQQQQQLREMEHAQRGRRGRGGRARGMGVGRRGRGGRAGQGFEREIKQEVKEPEPGNTSSESSTVENVHGNGKPTGSSTAERAEQTTGSGGEEQETANTV